MNKNKKPCAAALALIGINLGTYRNKVEW